MLPGDSHVTFTQIVKCDCIFDINIVYCVYEMFYALSKIVMTSENTNILTKIP